MCMKVDIKHKVKYFHLLQQQRVVYGRYHGYDQKTSSPHSDKDN